MVVEDNWLLKRKKEDERAPSLLKFISRSDPKVHGKDSFGGGTLCSNREERLERKEYRRRKRQERIL